MVQRVIFPEGASPLWADWKPEPLVRRKVVYREVCTKGSETTKSGTDEQKVHMRHLVGDKRPQQRNVRRLPKPFRCRCTSDWTKEKVLTRGGLLNHEMVIKRSQQKS